MKKLIILTHPNIENSNINKRLLEEVKKYPNEFDVHELYKEYPNLAPFDIEKEHKILESYDEIVFQFPIFWFSCPFFFKKWLEDVVIHGWAFGDNNCKLEHKKIALAVSTGSKEADYKLDGRVHHTLEQLLAPYELLFEQYCHVDYKKPFVFFGSRQVVEDAKLSKDNEIEKGAKRYIEFLRSL